MKLPKRFALRTLLLLMLVVASVFGYAEWRKQQLKAQVAKLEASGVAFIELTGNSFWPTVETPVSPVLLIESFGTDRFLCKGNMVGTDAAINHYLEISQRLRAIGVENVIYRWQYAPLPLVTATKDIESLEEIRQPFFSFMDAQNVPDGFVPPEEAGR